MCPEMVVKTDQISQHYLDSPHTLHLVHPMCERAVDRQLKPGFAAAGQLRDLVALSASYDLACAKTDRVLLVGGLVDKVGQGYHCPEAECAPDAVQGIYLNQEIRFQSALTVEDNPLLLDSSGSWKNYSYYVGLAVTFASMNFASSPELELTVTGAPDED